MASLIMDILGELEFDRFLAKESPHTRITSESFTKLEPLKFRLVYYFLFKLYAPLKAKTRFQSVYPSRDIKQETEFRQTVIFWLTEIGEVESQFGKVLPIYFQRLSGSPFIKLTTRFAILVLKKKTDIPDDFSTVFGPAVSVTKAEEVVNTLTDDIDRFEEAISEGEGKVLPVYDECINRIAQLEPQHIKFSKYGSAKFWTKVNAKLTADLDRVNRYVVSIIDGIHTKPSIPTARSNNSGLSKSSLTECGQSKFLIDRVKQFDQMIKLIKENPEIYTFLKVVNDLKMKGISAESTIRLSESVVLKLRETLARLKGEAFDTPQGREARQLVMDYFKPTLELSLNFFDYGLDKGWLLNAENEGEVKQIKIEKGIS